MKIYFLNFVISIRELCVFLFIRNGGNFFFGHAFVCQNLSDPAHAYSTADLEIHFFHIGFQIHFSVDNVKHITKITITICHVNLLADVD